MSLGAQTFAGGLLSNGPGSAGGTFTGAVYFDDGTSVLPGAAFAGAHGTGIYRSGTTIGFSVAGVSIMRVDNNGTFIPKGAVGISDGNSYVQSPSSGVIKLSDNNDTNFARLQFGGTTSSFPALKRSTTQVAVRLADDSADAGLTVAGVTASDAVVVTASTTNAAAVTGTGNGTGAGVVGTGGATGVGGSFTAAANYGLVVQGDTTSPAKAAMRFVPQDTDPSSPSEGDVYYNSVTHKLRFYNGTAWGDVQGAA